MTRVIGITGGIGSGKSTVSHMLADFGAATIDADKVGHEAYQPGSKAFKAVTAEFGQDVVAPTGEIDRKKLAAKVFGKPEALARLNAIVHPAVREKVKERIDSFRKQNVPIIVLEVILLIEVDWTDLVNEVWVVVSPEKSVIERVRIERGMAEEQTIARIRSQMTNEERVNHADVVIRNEGSLDDLKNKVETEWRRLIGRSSNS